MPTNELKEAILDLIAKVGTPIECPFWDEIHRLQHVWEIKGDAWLATDEE